MRIRFLTAALAAFFMLPLLLHTALAAPEDWPETVVGTEEMNLFDEQPAETPLETRATSPNPFTPSGTGTVINAATDADGKEFFTIMTADESVFYLVIDRQRGTENVYFLNAVTAADLMALAEFPAEAVPVAPTTPPPAVPSPEPEAPPAETPPMPEPEQSGGINPAMYAIIAVAALLGVGAGWYFKLYRPKHRVAANDDEYAPPADGAGFSDDWDETPPWDTDESGDDK